MAASEPHCPPWAVLALGWGEPTGQSVQRLPMVWGCPTLSLQLVLGT